MATFVQGKCAYRNMESKFDRRLTGWEVVGGMTHLLCVPYPSFINFLKSVKAEKGLLDKAQMTNVGSLTDLLAVMVGERIQRVDSVRFPSQQTSNYAAAAALASQMNDSILSSNPLRIMAFEFMTQPEVLPGQPMREVPSWWNQKVSLSSKIYPKLFGCLGSGLCLSPPILRLLEMNQLIWHFKNLKTDNTFINEIRGFFDQKLPCTIPQQYDSCRVVQDFILAGLDSSRMEAAKCSLGFVVKFYDDLKTAYMRIIAERHRQIDVVCEELRRMKEQMTLLGDYRVISHGDSSMQVPIKTSMGMFKTRAIELLDELQRMTYVSEIKEINEESSMKSPNQTQELAQSCVWEAFRDLSMMNIVLADRKEGFDKAVEVLRKGGQHGCMMYGSVKLQSVCDHLRQTMEEALRRVVEEYKTEDNGEKIIETVVMWLIHGQENRHLLLPLSAIDMSSIMDEESVYLSILKSIRSTAAHCSGCFRVSSKSPYFKWLQRLQVQLLFPTIAFDCLHGEIDQQHLQDLRLLSSSSPDLYADRYIKNIRYRLNETYTRYKEWDEQSRRYMPDGETTTDIRWITEQHLRCALHNMQLASQYLSDDAMSPIRKDVFKCLFECLDKHDICGVVEESVDITQQKEETSLIRQLLLEKKLPPSNNKRPSESDSPTSKRISVDPVVVSSESVKATTSTISGETDPSDPSIQWISDSSTFFAPVFDDNLFPID